ncbi:NAC domain-containing protein 67-like [Olea europaea var. sylvestris]|uniref:NAC domain-containing 67-like n=1 Tax=Olea europaea subsp. europaea TaxID=158383 RepID=A0A8S0VF21_OLEEU|nr:NAC domain-containing protein 67-like [Olea europaea var. sylvestris]CAA3030392.1 NAC domain-containing 67-like [Olea europaea subsp. europaea]
MMESNPRQTVTAALTYPIDDCIPSTSYTYDDYFSRLTDYEYFGSLPPGIRFVPRDDELIDDYLIKKIRNEELPRNKINVLNLYEFNPEQLAKDYEPAGPNEWYFFTPRNRKYKNGQRPDRAAGEGYWKATGADKQIKRNGEIIGYQKALVFYDEKPKGVKTSWIMHEYRVNNLPPRQRKGADDMKLDDWVLCKVYNNEGKWNNARKRQRANKNQVQEPNNGNDQAAAGQEKNDHTLEVHRFPPHSFPNYRNPYNVVYPDVYDVPPYQNAEIYSNLAPITMLSPINSTHDLVSMEQYHESSGIPTMDRNKYLDMESLLHMENKPYDYSLLFQPRPL